MLTMEEEGRNIMNKKTPDDLIAMKYRPGLFSQSGNYLFSVSRHGIAQKEGYSAYVIFMSSITEILRDFGIHISNNGYSYIIDSVMIIIDLSSMDIKLNNDVYPFIANKYGFKNKTAVEHNIRNAIRSACLDNERNPGTNKMGVFRKRPTNKQFLMYVAEAVSRRMYEEMMSQAG